jgi:drug/metabolite transporter (DMT)-like permease
MDKNEIRGYLYILIGATLWGVSSVVAKSLFNIGLPPALLVQIRLTLATFTLLTILLIFDRKRITISLGDLPYFIVLGFVGVAGVQFTYYYTISKIHVGPAVLIQYLSPIWIAFYAFLFQKEPLTKGKMTALLLAVVGCYFTVGGYRMDLLRLNRIGILSGLISSLFFSFYALYGEKGLKKYDPWTLILYGFGFGAVFYWILISPMKVISEGYSFKIWMAFLYIAIFSTLIPFGLYFKGIERIRATRASITATWEPVVAGMTAYFVLGEALFPLQVLGGIGVIAAIILLQMAKEKAAPSTPIDIRQPPHSSPLPRGRLCRNGGQGTESQPREL